MGNTAKFMLVGILVMVIVIAVIWDRHSSDLRRPVSVSSRNLRRLGSKSPLELDVEPEQQQVTGEIEGSRAAQDVQAAAEGLQKVKNVYSKAQKPAAGVKQEKTQPAASQAPGKPASKVRSYTVQEGDSFWTIARKFYGSALQWREIWQVNRKLCPTPRMLRAGMKIVLPEIKGAKMTASLDESGKRYYTVQKGDCPSEISKKFYGTARKWHRILEANKIEDERDLKAGMKIIIP